MKNVSDKDVKDTVLKIFAACSDNLEKCVNEAIKSHDAQYCVKLRAEIQKVYKSSLNGLNALNGFFRLPNIEMTEIV